MRLPVGALDAATFAPVLKLLRACQSTRFNLLLWSISHRREPTWAQKVLYVFQALL